MPMRISALLLVVFALAACSRGDEEHAREQARQAAEQLKHDSQTAFRKAEVETKKASRELNDDLEKARQKTRRALDQPNTPADKDRQ
jgi:hypothetical protein